MIYLFTEKEINKMAAPDQELKKAFGELQMKMIESKQKIKLNDIQVQGYIYMNIYRAI